MKHLKTLFMLALAAGCIYVGLRGMDKESAIENSGQGTVGDASSTAETSTEEAAEDKGEYDPESGLYVNEKYGFQIAIPSEWTTYSVKEAISCPTIQKTSADNYFLLASPIGSTETLLTIDKMSCPPDYMDSLSEKKRKSYVSHDRAPLLYEVTNIGEFEVYRAGFKIGGAYRENCIFTANHQLIEIYLIAKSPDAPEVYEMRSVIDDSLSRI